MNKRILGSLVNVAMGREKADLLITNANVVNVYNGEIMNGYSIAVKGEKIAYVGINGEHTIGKKTNVMDAAGKTVIPGFIESHTHIDTPVVPVQESSRYSMLSGTTTIITETLEIANVLGYTPGYECLLHLLKSLSNLPIKLFITAPSPSPSLSDFEDPMSYSAKDIRDMLKLNRVLGIGETPWIPVVDCDDFILSIIEKGHETGKPLEGHSSGAKGNNLIAYATTGISSCHEAITADEALERSRLGMYVMIREGSIRRDLEAVSAVKDKIKDFRRFVLVTDGLGPEDMTRDGHMSFVVQKAIDLGFKPVNAIQMATINPAEHFSLDSLCGGIAPSRDADMVIIPDINTIHCETVISKGRIVVHNGKLLVQPKRYTPTEAFLKTVHTGRKFSSADFHIPVESSQRNISVRVIELINGLITREISTDLQPVNGYLESAPDRDILKIAVIDRYHGTGKSFTGLVRGVGLKKGAFASSYCWESGSPIVVIGASDEDMALAVNRIIDLQGGLIVCAENKILSELPLPIGGFIADCSIEEAAEKMHHIRENLHRLGCTLSNPYLTIQTLSGTFLPFFRITQKGLVNIKDKKLVDLVHNP